MLLSFLITFISFALFFKSLPLKPLPTWAAEMRSVSLCFWEKSPFSLVSEVVKNSLFPTFSIILFKMSMKKKTLTPYLENVEKEENLLISDLPELVLECILERLSPQGLCSMAAVCSSMRERCSSDHLWERHMRQKWGKIIGSAAQREWKWQIATRKDSSGLEKRSGRGLVNLVSRLWPLSWIFNNGVEQKSLLPDDSIMSWYLALESGRFWFPAQVYNRENGHVGFMLSCYDAELRYDSCTDTFQARYPPHGRRAVAIEHCVPWERLRAPPIDTPPHDLHISECLNELCPNDNIEIQWRRNKEFPYGWWYGVVGHLESCGGNESQCHCRNSDTVVLVFNQYTAGSRWRRTTIHRKNHREEGNETDGFYGGVRKLCTDEDISTWRRLWPADVLE